ncbi:MAG TPA: SBBP repeat-containing protein [Verrucomicrobiae bacterium]|nr:SBBP repeat-containing protein [Verrucomicrobiae bacterium]
MKMNFGIVVLLFVLCLLTRESFAQGGVSLWTNRFNGTGSNNDEAKAVASDLYGNVVIAGTSVDAGNSSPKFAIIKCSSMGTPLWTNRYHGDVVSALGVDVSGNGNVYVVGNTYRPTSGGRDFVTLAYSSSGIPLWTNTYQNRTDGIGSDLATALAVGGNGNIYVTGYSSETNSTRTAYATIAYSSSGVPLWTNRYTGSTSTLVGSGAYAIAVGANGNVYVTGLSQGDHFTDYATIAYSSDGAVLWINRYGGGVCPDQAKSIAVDNETGNVYVTGYSDFLVDGNPDYVTIGYSSSGLALWTNRLYSSGRNIPVAMAVGANGDVIVTGSSSNAFSGNDFSTIAYSSLGVPLWTNRYNGPANAGDAPYGMALDKSGNIFVTGYSAAIETGNDYVTLAYSSEGVPLWTNRYNRSLNYLDIAQAVTVDGDGNVVVTGRSDSNGFNNSHDFVTIKYAGQSPSPIPIEVQKAGAEIVLTWLDARFELQSAPSATGTYTNVLGAASPYTNASPDWQQYFRLKAN